MAKPSQRPATQTYVKPEAAITVLSSWWWAVCGPKRVKQLRNTRIINYATRLHLVGSFYEIYITTHGSVNIKFITHVCRWGRLNGSHIVMSEQSFILPLLLILWQKKILWFMNFWLSAYLCLKSAVH